MSLFELTFSLNAVILALALTHLATSFTRLALAGRRVRWAPEPVLLSVAIFLVIVSVWLFSWWERDTAQTTIGMMLLQVLKLLLPFMAAVFVLPEHVPEAGDVDLFQHYDRTRALTFGSLIGGLLLFWLYRLIELATGPGLDVSTALQISPWHYVLIYLLLIFVRTRWINVAALSAVIVYYLWLIVPLPLQA